MFPRLHIVKVARIAALPRHGNLTVVEGKTRMASNSGEQPKDLISTEFRDQVSGEIRVRKVTGAADKGLV